MSNFQDERDFAEEAANADLLREDPELADYEIDPGDDARTYTEDDKGNWHEVRPPVIQAGPAQRDDADLTADAMKALEDQILAAVPDGQRDEVQDLLSNLLDLAPGQALSPEAAEVIARKVLETARKALAPRRTLTDEQINTYARFYPHHEAADDSDITGYPCVALGGDEDDAGAVQAYVYAEDGGVVVSLHFDSAGPVNGSGPWAYYGPDGAIPVTVIGGNGEPVYVADEHTPDLSDALTAEAGRLIAAIHDARRRDDSLPVAVHARLETVLRSFLAVTGTPYSGDSAAEGEPGA